MADQSYGLRFDIYERVHLSDDVIGIEELEEIELFPKIQVIPGEEYAALRGHLLLSGLYRGEGETRELEHWIPVEITIPLSRVNRLEDITVEIENFDVDLLSSRSLNITGVLSLQGIETSSLLPDNDSWKDREFTTAHVVPGNRIEEPEESAPKPSVPLIQEEVQSALQTSDMPPWQAFPEDLPAVQKRSADEQEEVLTWTEDIAAFQDSSLWADKEYGASPAGEPEPAEEPESNLWFKGEIRPSAKQDYAEWQKEAAEADAGADIQAFQEQHSVPAFSEAGAETGWPNEPAGNVNVEPEVAGEAEAENLPNVQPEEKKAMKIALGSKKSSAENEKESFGLTKLISSSRTPQEPQEEAEDTLAGANEAAEDQEDGEELRWKNLFISSGEDQNPFRKVKLVIVQREETLDDIAQRYHLSSRELQLYNRLSEHQLAEGQILYIP